MNVLFVQTGHYAEAYERLKSGGQEAYRDQRASVDWVESLSQSCSVTVLCISGDTHEDVQLSPTLRAVNVSYEKAGLAWLRTFFDEILPDRLICRTPHHLVLRLAKQRRIRTLPNFADYFANGNLRQLYRNLRLRWVLSSRYIPCVSNHNLNASESVARALFYPKSRVVPWDHYNIDADYETKTGLQDRAVLRIFYAGLLEETKGVGDIFEAITHLKSQGMTVHLSLAGAGNEDTWKSRTTSLGIDSSVTFLGRIPRADVLEQMHAHDVVVVPSRWEYAEGLPNVLYEALATHTPLITSDHPAFADRLIHEQHCLSFPAGNPRALAEVLRRLANDPALYKALSETSAETLQTLRFGLYWDQLWQLFLDDPDAKSGWVQEHSLAIMSV